MVLGSLARSSEHTGRRTQAGWTVFHSSVVGGNPTALFQTNTRELQFCRESKREAEREQGRGSADVGKGDPQGKFLGVCAKEIEEQTSYTEYGVDALALKAEEGRGDRRNVQGELHTSDEP